MQNFLREKYPLWERSERSVGKFGWSLQPIGKVSVVFGALSGKSETHSQNYGSQ